MCRRRELFQIEPGRFPQVRDCLVKSFALADDADLGAFGNIPSFFPVYQGGVTLNRR
jgi:hypothetical protein